MEEMLLIRTVLPGSEEEEIDFDLLNCHAEGPEVSIYF
jgi:hypothetical protein